MYMQMVINLLEREPKPQNAAMNMSRFTEQKQPFYVPVTLPKIMLIQK